jgi:C_GCAxxG_C_C family probable redox protein
MFRSISKREEISMRNIAEKVAIEAEGFYRSGSMHCAEAVLAAIRNSFMPAAGDEIVRLAAGFGGGSGAGCICGAVSGGTIALGLVLQEDKKRVMALTRELHKWFKGEHGVTCCKVITAKGKSCCPLITAQVAGKVAELLS